MSTVCPDCSHSFHAEDAHFCPMCGATIPASAPLTLADEADQSALTQADEVDADESALTQADEVDADESALTHGAGDSLWMPPRRPRRGLFLAAGAIALVAVTSAVTWTIARTTQPAALAEAAPPASSARLTQPAPDLLLAGEPAPAAEPTGLDAPIRRTAAAATTAADRGSVRARRHRRRSRRSSPAPARTTQTTAPAAADSRSALERAQAAALALADADDGAADADDAADTDPDDDTDDTDADEPGPVAIAPAADKVPAPAPTTAERTVPEPANQAGPAGSARPAGPAADADGEDGEDGEDGGDAGRAKFFIQLGRVQLARDQPTQAAASFSRALALDPGNPEARAGLAEAHNRTE